MFLRNLLSEYKNAATSSARLAIMADIVSVANSIFIVIVFILLQYESMRNDLTISPIVELLLAALTYIALVIPFLVVITIFWHFIYKRNWLRILASTIAFLLVNAALSVAFLPARNYIGAFLNNDYLLPQSAYDAIKSVHIWPDKKTINPALDVITGEVNLYEGARPNDYVVFVYVFDKPYYRMLGCFRNGQPDQYYWDIEKNNTFNIEIEEKNNRLSSSEFTLIFLRRADLKRRDYLNYTGQILDIPNGAMKRHKAYIERARSQSSEGAE